VFAALRKRLLEARPDAGFGMIELLCAMMVLSVGVLAVYAMFESGTVQIKRAANTSTAAALADSEIEKFRAIKYNVIGLDDSAVAGADTLYQSDSAYQAETSPATTLSAGIDEMATTLTVASAAGFPTAAPFRIKIDGEVLLVESGAGTTTWTVKRAQDGTMAAAHASGAAVTQKKRVHLAACGVSPCTTYSPTNTVTGADGKSYRVDLYITWDTPQNTSGTTGRNLKLVTLVVRDGTDNSKVYARVSSAFDESTGL
jgi:prepilin-type N-terminal cleavage/methylation domain-containing protein